MIYGSKGLIGFLLFYTILCVSLSAYQNLTYFITFSGSLFAGISKPTQTTFTSLHSSTIYCTHSSRIFHYPFSYYGPTRPFTLKTTFFFCFP